jgi:hypothetical protein
MFKLSTTRCHARRVGIAGNQPLEVSVRILLGACRPPGGFDHLTSHHIEMNKPREGSMPDILPPRVAGRDLVAEEDQGVCVRWLARRSIHPC